MTLHVCVLGIDGSGKSTITAALPAILAAELGLVAGAAGETFRVTDPDEDHLAPKFHPDGLPVSARLTTRFKRTAKRLVDSRRLYPAFKIAQLVTQDIAAAALARRYRARVIVSDGNALLSATGRAANYLRAASDGGHKPAPSAEDLRAVFSYIIEGRPIPPETQRRLPRLQRARAIYKLAGDLGLRAVWLPDLVIFLDLPPEISIARIASRGKKVDRHENLADLAQAREMYLKSLEAFGRYRSFEATYRIPLDDLSPGDTIGALVEALRPYLLAGREEKMASGEPLGTSRRTGGAMRKTALDHRYLIRYLLAKWFRGAWREPTFLFSSLGRLFLDEGYSAGVMRVIYDQDEKRYGLLDRVFLEYPLHRAVYDRLQILTRKIEAELEARLQAGREVRIFTAPSGFAYDLFRPLETIARRLPELMDRVEIVATDLDPHEALAGELAKRAEKLGIRFTFLRGDMTDGEMRRRFEARAPFFSSPLDGRSLFLAKHEGCFLYGTSDYWEEADPGAPIPAEKDVEYLLSTLDRFMPEAGLDGDKVRFVYSGFRPLLCPEDGDLDSVAASREDHIEVSPSGLISVIGGKLTTARIMAIRVLDRVIEKIGGSTTWSRCSTHRLSIGGTNEAVAEGLAYWVKRYPRLAWYFQILYQRYGLDAHTICREAMAIHKGLDPDPRAEPIRAEVRYVCRNEMVCTLEDLLERRAGFLYWSSEQRLERARYGARVIRAELDLTEKEFEYQFAMYSEHLTRFHSLPGSVP